jgi:hypothetical protein
LSNSCDRYLPDAEQVSGTIHDTGQGGAIHMLDIYLKLGKVHGAIIMLDIYLMISRVSGWSISSAVHLSDALQS